MDLFGNKEKQERLRVQPFDDYAEQAGRGVSHDGDALRLLLHRRALFLGISKSARRGVGTSAIIMILIACLFFGSLAAGISGAITNSGIGAFAGGVFGIGWVIGLARLDYKAGRNRVAASAADAKIAQAIAQGQCPNCSYDLSGLYDAIPSIPCGPTVCPECGEAWPLVPPASFAELQAAKAKRKERDATTALTTAQ